MLIIQIVHIFVVIILTFVLKLKHSTFFDMKNKITIKFLMIAALLIIGNAQMFADDELYQKLTSVSDINPEDEFAICQENGNYALKTDKDALGTTSPGKANLINGYLLITTTLVPDHIKLIPVESETNTYLLQVKSSSMYIQGGTNSAKDLKLTTDMSASRLKWKLVVNNDSLLIMNVETELYICNNASKFSCNKSNSTYYSCLYKKVSQDGDLIIKKEYDSYSSFVTLTSTDYDFTETNDLKAFIVTDANKQKVTLQQVTQVPAGTPIILYGNRNHYIAKKLAKGTVNKLSNNILKEGDSSVSGDASTIYAIAEKNGKVGFYKVNKGVKFPAGSVYLVIKESGAKDFYAFDEEVTTGISHGFADQTARPADNNWYNLNGMRIDAPLQKGIYIHNGKKVIVK